MSLWYKPVDEITYADVDAFLRLGQPEGTRLNYKADVPKELAKLVGAFANTLGGIIVLGVNADKKTNTPLWPTLKDGRGLPDGPGLDERIISICRDNLYPPLRPLVSPTIRTPHLPGHSLAVIRAGQG
jgi:predicted HTH transcriptional regulator